jgi:hypothetical protein
LAKGTKHKHYIFSSGYIISNAKTPEAITRLEAFIESFTFGQGNKFAYGALVGIIQALEKGDVNWVD